MTQSAVPLIVRRLIPGSPELVFDAFSDRQSLEQWFTPNPGIVVEVLEFAFVTNGRFRFRYTMGNGRQAVVGGVYETIVRPSRIAMSWIFEAPDPLANVPMRVAFDFLGKASATQVTVTHEGIPTDQACTVHQDGWEGTFDQLEELWAGA